VGSEWVTGLIFAAVAVAAVFAFVWTGGLLRDAYFWIGKMLTGGDRRPLPPSMTSVWLVMVAFATAALLAKVPAAVARSEVSGVWIE
jgi:hypothetical protein